MENQLILNISHFGIALFLCGIFITFATKNIFKIFLGVQISLISAILILFLNKSPQCSNLALCLTFCLPILAFCGLFLIKNIYLKFRTADLTQIEKITRDKENNG